MPEHVGGPESVVEQYPLEDSWVVVARGDLDQDSLPPLRQAVDEAVAAHPVVVLDVGAVTFADSSFLHLLLRVHQAATLRIAAAQAQLLRMLEITGADRVLHLYPSATQADGAVTP